jgi:hypothetical protein
MRAPLRSVVVFVGGSPKFARTTKPVWPARRVVPPWRPQQDVPSRQLEEMRREGRRVLEQGKLDEQARIARRHEIERHLANGYAMLRAAGLKAA